MNSGTGECFRETRTGKLVGLNPAIVWPVSPDGDELDELLSEKNAARDWSLEAYSLAKEGGGHHNDGEYRAEVAWRNFHYLLVNRLAQASP